jgi:DNA-binding IclR family transcriptional regulator
MMIEISSVTGSIARAAQIIDVLTRAPGGLGLAQIVARSEFSKTTAFRVLANLQEVGYVYQDPESRHYFLGYKLGKISQTAARTTITAMAIRGMERLASITGDTIFLSVPEGAAAICVARKTGAFPIRTLTLNTGDSRPLGVGAGALALYCAMNRTKREAVTRTNKNWMLEFGISKQDLDAGFDAYTRTGYAANIGRIVAGTSAISLPVITTSGQVAGALAIGAIDARMTITRMTETLLPALEQETAVLAARINEMEQG